VKLLPCTTTKCQRLGAVWGPSPAFPDGEPAFTGSYVGRYKCHRCGKVRNISLAHFNSLPQMKLEDWEALAKRPGCKAAEAIPTRDLEGCGFTRGQSRDLFRFGLGPEDVHALHRADEGALSGTSGAIKTLVRGEP
jgi:hypothetical protein